MPKIALWVELDVKPAMLEAFLAHRETPHFKRYAAQSETMIETRKVTRLAAEVGGAP